MNAKQAKELSNNPELLKRLAKCVALHSVRNTELENLHAGIVPNSATGDFSDVKVVSPFGEIPWPELSRFSDAEMKRLMVDVVDHTYMMMFSLFGVPDRVFEDFLDTLKRHDPQPAWDEPKMPISGMLTR